MIDTARLVSTRGLVRADVYLILAGLNDARLHGLDPASLDAYSTALDAVVSACEAAAPEAAVMLIQQPPLLHYNRFSPHDQGSGSAVDAYNRRMAGVAVRHRQAILVHVDGWVAATMLDDDTVHPNDLGHATIAAAVARVYRDTSIGRTSPVHD